MQMKRFVLYYRLLNLATAMQTFVIVDAFSEHVLGNTSIGDLAPPKFHFTVAFTVMFFAFVLPAFLIFQRWMRDELSEALWQKTAGTVLKLLVVAPLPLAAIATQLIYQNPPVLDLPTHTGISRETEAFLEAFLDVTLYAWVFTPFMFTLVFQWYRWRTSR